MKLRLRVDLAKRDRMAIAHSQGLSVASTEEDCLVAIETEINQYLESVRNAYTLHLNKKKPNQGKSNGK